MKTLVWSDVHNRVNRLKTVLSNLGDDFDNRVFLGDWFDQYGDSVGDARMTAFYLKELLQDPKNFFCEGNHDTPYRFGNDASYCPGWTKEKHAGVKEILGYNDWQKFQLCHYINGFLLSHAGVHERVFQHPIRGITVEGIKEDCQKAVDALRCNTIHPVYADGMSNGGRAPVGGITWLRWWDFHPIPDLNQIVGHTICTQPEISYARRKVSKHNGQEKTTIENVKVSWSHYQDWAPKADTICSMNYNLDTCNNHFIIIEDGVASIHLTLDYL